MEKNKLQQLAEKNEQAAYEEDLFFFTSCPEPLAPNATEKETEEFFAQIDAAMAASDKRIEKRLAEKANQ